MDQMQFDGMPPEILLHAEGALVTVWRNPDTGYHEALVVTFDASGEQVKTRWEDAGPFDVTEALQNHQDHLRRLNLL